MYLSSSNPTYETANKNKKKKLNKHEILFQKPIFIILETIKFWLEIPIAVGKTM